MAEVRLRAVFTVGSVFIPLTVFYVKVQEGLCVLEDLDISVIRSVLVFSVLLLDALAAVLFLCLQLTAPWGRGFELDQ